MDDVEISGADFSQKVELSEAGYYEYLVNISYLGISLDALPVKIKDLVGLELVPVESKAGAIYYGTDLSTAGRKVPRNRAERSNTDIPRPDPNATGFGDCQNRHQGL